MSDHQIRVTPFLEKVIGTVEARSGLSPAQMVSPNMSDEQWFEMVVNFPTADLQQLLPMLEAQADKFRQRAERVRMILELDKAGAIEAPLEEPCDHSNATKARYSGGNYGHYGFQRCLDCGAVKDDYSDWKQP